MNPFSGMFLSNCSFVLFWIASSKRLHSKGSPLKTRNPVNISTFVSTLSFGWYDIVTWATSNQRWNNFVCFYIGIYNVEQRWISVVYFNVDVDKVRQRRNNVVLFKLSFTTLVNVKTTLWKWLFPKRNLFQIEYTQFKVLNAKASKIKIMKNTALQELDLNCSTL